ncbi:MAG: sugar ABC transporter permease [Candidatus Pacearchaeota archaeon]|nr:sugar ABC transporter permease [Candidatus Pacearchaeota archaeon]
MKKINSKAKNAGSFFLFMGPSLILFTCVLIIPFLYGFYLTFTNYSPVSDTRDFVGFNNFISVFLDKEFLNQFLKTFKYVIYSTIFSNIIAFFLAALLTSKIKGKNFLRAGFFTPNLIGGIVLGYIWKFIFSNVITQIGKYFQFQPLMKSMLTDPDNAILAMIIVTVWQYAGYMMVIYVAGFISIPKAINEAAEVDGATGMKKLFRITIPLMVPSFIICLFISLSRCFMVYDFNLALTNGDPYGSTRLASMHIYHKAFLAGQYGIGQAEAFILFVVVAIIAVYQVVFMKKFEVEA